MPLADLAAALLPWSLGLLTVQGLLGAYDNFRNHEFREGLAYRARQRFELGWHTARELLYLLAFPTFAGLNWHGVYAWIFAAILLVEIHVTLADFVEEDRSRTLSAHERVLHTLLTLNWGAAMALFVPTLLAWGAEPDGIELVWRGVFTPIMLIFTAGVLLFALREGLAALRLARASAAPADPAPLVRAAVGPASRALLTAMHGGGARVFTGTLDLSSGLAGRLTGWLTGLPCRRGPVATRVEVTQEGGGEMWVRYFGTDTFRTRIDAGRHPGELIERFGPVTLRFRIIERPVGDENGIDWTLTGLRLFGIPVPRRLWPRFYARDGIDAAGVYRVDVRVHVPGLGLLIGYRGVMLRES